jgi:PLP dependent protein
LHNSINNLTSIQNTLKTNKVKIIAVSKTFPINEILPLINHGHIHFGENKVQEAIEKWQKIKKDFNHLQLHMIGKLQTNKVKFAVSLFDYIHSLDSLKLAKKISEEQNKIKKKLKIFIQINIGNEEQKNGIYQADLNEFYNSCVNELGLDIIGLMCLPPKEDGSKKYFLKMKNLAKNLDIQELSMGMSNDYLDAANNGSTFLRIGTKIFGKRS